MPMLRIRMLSGEDVAEVPLDEHTGVWDVKQHLHKVYGLPPRFRQRLLLAGESLEDATRVEASMELELVLLAYSEPSAADVEELMDAAARGSVAEVESMLQRPIDPDTADDDGCTALMQASPHGHVDVMKLLLEAGASLDKANSDGYTALMAASVQNRVEVVRLLLEGGAQVDLANTDGWTALTLASQLGHMGVVQLLGAGADHDPRQR